MKTQRSKAIVLRRTNYGEADRIVQFLTPDYGKVSVMAKGARREKSKLAGGIELFARCDISFSTGRGDLAILTGARLDIFYSHIMADYDRLQFGYDCIKNITKASETINEPAFFDLLDQVFAAINDTSIQLNITKAWFWLQLAIILGVGVNLTTDTNGMKLVEDARYNYAPGEHSFIFTENGTFTSDHIKLLRVLSAQPPQVASHVNGIGDLIGDCLWVAEQSVAH